MVVRDERGVRVALERGRHVMLRVQRSVLRDSVECATFSRVAAERDCLEEVSRNIIHRCPERLSAT